MCATGSLEPFCCGTPATGRKTALLTALVP
jgi:hypothetical protein